ncbi:MAG: hypothetical protein AAGA43_02345 [Bacteroidota bacterium]
MLLVLVLIQLSFQSRAQDSIPTSKMEGINRLQFSIDIKAEKSNIWQVLWDEQSYRKWAGIFYEGSYVVAEDDWGEGSKVLFLAPDESGIYSIIKTHIPNQIIQFEHIGNVLKGKEQPVDEETKKWSGATEKYSLTDSTNSNILTIEIDVLHEHQDFMKTKLPLALEKIKSLSEKQ